MITTKPIFYAVLGEGQGWRVEVEWPDGTIEQVDEFKLFSEATDWICNQSETWWQRRDWLIWRRLVLVLSIAPASAGPDAGEQAVAVAVPLMPAGWRDLQMSNPTQAWNAWCALSLQTARLGSQSAAATAVIKGGKSDASASAATFSVTMRRASVWLPGLRAAMRMTRSAMTPCASCREEGVGSLQEACASQQATVDEKVVNLASIATTLPSILDHATPLPAAKVA
jgi:hypothetical protein